MTPRPRVPMLGRDPCACCGSAPRLDRGRCIHGRGDSLCLDCWNEHSEHFTGPRLPGCAAYVLREARQGHADMRWAWDGAFLCGGVYRLADGTVAP